GGEKNIIFASGYLEAIPKSLPVISSTLCPSSFPLSSKGFSRTKACPTLDPCPDINPRLAVKVTFRTPGIFSGFFLKIFQYIVGSFHRSSGRKLHICKDNSTV